MAAINILSTAITSALATTVITALGTAQVACLANMSAGTAFKLNKWEITNNSTAAVACLANVHPATSLGGTPAPVSPNIPIPANSTLIVSGMDELLYITDSMSIGASGGTTLTSIVSGEIIS